MTSKVSCHARSISLPCTSHPLDPTTEDHLCTLRISASSSSSSSSSSICCNLRSIKRLYQRINDLILLPINQQVLSNHQGNRASVEAVLEGSLVLLDMCGASIDVVSRVKDSIVELESSLRRRRDNATLLSAYKASRRNVVRSASKCLCRLKKVETSRFDKNGQSVVFVVRILREAQAVCLSTLRSVLGFVSGSKARQGCSLVAKLTLRSHDLQEEANELERIDQALSGIDANCKKLKTDTKSVVQSLQKQLGVMEMTMDEIEDGLEWVSRCIVRTRVSLLNVLNH